MSVLSDELANDPLEPPRGYSSMTDEEASADLYTEYRTVNYPVQLDGLNLAIREAGKWTGFTEKAEVQTTPGTFDNPAMKEFMDLFPSLTGQNPIDLKGSYMNATDGLLSRCVTENSMGAAIAIDLESFGEQVVSRAVELGVSATNGDVQAARN